MQSPSIRRIRNRDTFTEADRAAEFVGHPLDRAVPLVATEDDPPPRGGQFGEALTASASTRTSKPLSTSWARHPARPSRTSSSKNTDCSRRRRLQWASTWRVGDVAGPGREPAPAVELVPLPPEDQVDLLEDVVHVAPRTDQGADIGEERPPDWP